MFNAQQDISMTFGQALKEIHNGHRLARAGWNSKGMWVCQVKNWNGNFGGDLPPDWSAAPFIAIKGVNNAMSPWTPSQQDMQATDWEVASFQTPVPDHEPAPAAGN